MVSCPLGFGRCASLTPPPQVNARPWGAVLHGAALQGAPGEGRTEGGTGVVSHGRRRWGAPFWSVHSSGAVNVGALLPSLYSEMAAWGEGGSDG